MWEISTIFVGIDKQKRHGVYHSGKVLLSDDEKPLGRSQHSWEVDEALPFCVLPWQSKVGSHRCHNDQS